MLLVPNLIRICQKFYGVRHNSRYLLYGDTEKKYQIQLGIFGMWRYGAERGYLMCCRNVAMIKSSKDTRYAKDSVVSHDGVKYPCWALPDLSSFKEKFGSDAYDKVLLIIISISLCVYIFQ